jgi:endonuclease YncB( thermonuclease family)
MRLVIGIILVLGFFAVYDVSAHQDGCHSKHSCPSDTGSYTCGDKGYCSQCPDNQYCKAGLPVSATISMPKQEPAQKTNSNLCKGNAMCITGTVKSIVDGDTIYIDTYKVRLSLVNTPERGQAGYSEATAFTKKLCAKGTVAIVDQDDKQPFDRFKRVVGKVYCSDKNVNAELLENKHATIMKKYCKTSEFASESWATKRGC